MTCGIYLLAHERHDGSLEGPVKVGISRAIGSRIASIQTGNPKKVALVFACVLPSADMARVVERHFHEDHQNYRLEGEWFDMTPHHAMLDLFIRPLARTSEDHPDTGMAPFNAAVERFMAILPPDEEAMH